MNRSLVACLLPLCLAPPSRAAGQKGPELQPPLIQSSLPTGELLSSLVERFNEQNPHGTLRCRPADKLRSAKSLINHQCDAVFREMRWVAFEDRELRRAFGDPANVPAFEVATVVVHVIVSSENPLTSLSLGDLEDLFTGRTSDWEAVGEAGLAGPVEFFSPPIAALDSYVMRLRGMRGRQFAERLRDYRSVPLRQMVSRQQLMQVVAKEPNAIAFLGTGPDTSFPQGVTVIAIRAKDDSSPIEPTQEELMEGRYPIMEPVMLYLAPNAGRALYEFADFLAGQDAQDILLSYGLFPSYKILPSAMANGEPTAPGERDETGEQVSHDSERNSDEVVGSGVAISAPGRRRNGLRHPTASAGDRQRQATGRAFGWRPVVLTVTLSIAILSALVLYRTIRRGSEAD